MTQRIYRDPKTGRFVSVLYAKQYAVLPTYIHEPGSMKPKEAAPPTALEIQPLKISRTRFSGRYVMHQGKAVREEDARGPRLPLPDEWAATPARRNAFEGAFHKVNEPMNERKTNSLIKGIQNGHGVTREEARWIAYRIVAQDNFNRDIDDIEVYPKDALRLW